MKNLEEINFTDEDFELMQKALGCVCLAESGNSPTSVLDAILGSMPGGGPMGAPSFFETMKRDETLRKKAEQKQKKDEFEERKITLQYKLIQFKKLLNSSEPFGEPRYTADEWRKFGNNIDEIADPPQKKSHEPAFSEES